MQKGSKLKLIDVLRGLPLGFVLLSVPVAVAIAATSLVAMLAAIYVAFDILTMVLRWFL